MILGPKPGAPWNVTIYDIATSMDTTISWNPPINADQIAVAYYQIQSRKENEQEWKPLNKQKLLPPQTSYTSMNVFYTFMNY